MSIQNAIIEQIYDAISEGTFRVGEHDSYAFAHDLLSDMPRGRLKDFFMKQIDSVDFGIVDENIRAFQMEHCTASC